VREQGAKAEIEIAWIARRQHGVITVAQLRALGVDKSGVTRRVRVGRLHRLHRGVYAVGHAAPSLHRDFMAAVLVSGKEAVLSHGSAAVLWGFLRPLEEPIHVTSPSWNGRQRHSGVALHRSPSLREKGMATLRERIPVTTPRRTIDDLEGAIEPRLFRRAKRQAELMKFKLTLPTDRTRSDLEGDFLRFLAKHGFPPPQVNVKVGKHTVDFLWPDHMLAVETDFFDYHRGSQAFEDDHQRDLELRRLGYTVRRYTGAQLDNYPAEIVAELGEVLSRAP